jgi:hypothetical protein
MHEWVYIRGCIVVVRSDVIDRLEENGSDMNHEVKTMTLYYI